MAKFLKTCGQEKFADKFTSFTDLVTAGSPLMKARGLTAPARKRIAAEREKWRVEQIINGRVPPPVVMREKKPKEAQ
jgi:hypothetical protein